MRLLAMLCTVFFLACGDDVRVLARTQLTLRVSASDEVREQLAKLRVSVAIARRDRAELVFERAQLAMWPVDLHVAPGLDNESTALVEVVAEAIDESGVVLVQQRALTQFLPRAKRVLPIGLARCGTQQLGALCDARGCIGETCLTCVAGGCASAPYFDPAQLVELTPSPGVRSDPPITIGAPATSETGAPRRDCSSPDTDVRCDDQQTCNGVEQCDPSAPSADARGCVPGTPIACEQGETCIEQMGGCSGCAVAADADGDGVASRTCGGTDCDDSDPQRFPGNPERCDAKDNDCNEMIDDANAGMSCGVPMGGTASCGPRGNCTVQCADPDFDVVDGNCLRHDDCAGVTSCGPGRCVDGVRSFTCACPSGYSGSGGPACVDVDECVANTLGCDTMPPACANQPGSAVCRCPATHFGTGVGAGGCARKAIGISAGNGYTCAVLEGGSVKCWGGNGFYRLGTGDVRSRGDLPGQMGDALAPIDLGAGRTASAVYAGADVTCAILDDRSVKCWGYDGYGSVTGLAGRTQPWMGTMGAGLPTVALPRRPLGLTAGGGQAFALLDDGSLAKWGPTVDVFQAGAGRKVAAFARSSAYDGAHYCAVLDAGQVVCWGAIIRDRGQLGSPAPLGVADAYLPVALGTGRRATALALGDAHSCALLDDARIKCWGDNTYGQLGLGDALPRGLTAAEMGDALPPVPLARPARAVAAGRNHSCALLDDGGVRCWGLNDLGQLGRGSPGNVGLAPGEIAALAPVDLGPGRTAVAIEAGTHTCALLDNGGIKCWGPNESGQLGQGNTTAIGTSGGMGAGLKEIDLGG